MRFEKFPEIYKKTSMLKPKTLGAEYETPGQVLFVQHFLAEHHLKTASDYSNVNSTEGGIGKQSCKIMIQKLKHTNLS